jgi:three-Cys-motif partner protein
MRELVPASDGYAARELHNWTREKLYYVERYLDIFCTGMKGKWSLAYADLLAGPGLCRDPKTGEEHLGSPLLAVKRPEFRRLFLNDMEPVVTEALAARTAAEPEGRVRIATEDCNTVVDAVRDALFPAGPRGGTLGLAMIDPFAFEMGYEAIARLTADLRIDLMIVFMTGSLRRFISRPGSEGKLDRFFGTAEWRRIVHAGDGEKVTSRKLLDLYEGQLRDLGYLHVDDHARMLNSKNTTMYHLILASKHKRGAEFFGKISQETYSNQRKLPLL